MKILVVLSRVPYPLEKGDKLRAYHQLRLLSQKHDLYLVALHDKRISQEAIDHLKPFCKEIHVLRQAGLRRFFNLLRAFFIGLPLQCGYFYSSKNNRRIAKIIEMIKPDRIYCQLFRMAEYVKNYPIKKTLDYQDVFSKGMLRRYERTIWPLKPFFKMEYRRIRKYEQQIFDYFDEKTIITAVDRDLIPHSSNKDIEIVTNGVDFEQFSYHGEPKIYDLIFAGNMSYAPNVDAAQYLATQIFPPLKKEFPSLKLVLCGATPNPAVNALRQPDIIITGWVDSIAEWYAQSNIFIAPMRMGTGLQNKLLEAMSTPLPCITSHLAGKPLEGAESTGALITCSTTAGYIEAARLLLTNESCRTQMANAGSLYVHQHYDWESATHKLCEILER